MAHVNGAPAAGPGLSLGHPYDPVRVSGQHRVFIPGSSRLLFKKTQDILPQLFHIASKYLVLPAEPLIKGHAVDHVLRHKIPVALFSCQLYGTLHKLLHISAEFHLSHLFLARCL